MKDDHGSTHGDNKWQEGAFSLLEFLVFQIRNYSKKTKFGWGAKKNPYHFGQINFNMSNVTRVVFFDWQNQDHLIG
jgi:hypothetical protein